MSFNKYRVRIMTVNFKRKFEYYVHKPLTACC